MKLLKHINNKKPIVTQQLTEESAGGSVDGSAVAINPMPLFSSMIKRKIPTKPKVIRYSNTDNKVKNTQKTALYMLQALRLAEEFTPDKPKYDGFNIEDVMSKLKSLEDKESIDRRDLVSFGLNDSDGNIIKISVPSEQADSFEQELQHILQYQSSKQDKLEVAEVLFELKDRYNIVDVIWPNSEENAEEDASSIDKKDSNKPMDVGAESNEPEGDLDMSGELPSSDQNGDITNLLTQVIDMLRADADAKKADAQAREAEAKTRQAMAARDQAKARVSQEEQYLEMDAYNKAQKSKDQEAKRLAQLAKWKHDVKNNSLTPKAQEPEYDFVPGEEEEMTLLSPNQVKKQIANKGAELRGRVQPADIAKYIMNRIK